MAKFMKGNYQWIFRQDKMKFFTGSEDGAAWIIKASNYEEICKNSKL